MGTSFTPRRIGSRAEGRVLLRTARRYIRGRAGRLLMLLLMAGSASCDRTSRRAEPEVSRSAPPLVASSSDPSHRQPIDVVRHAHDLRVARRWFELDEVIVPEQRASVSELVRATDALLNANDRLQHAIVNEHGHGVAIAFDRSNSGNVIGVFSVDVRMLGQRIDGDRALVTIQVADRVPVEQVELVLRDHRWLIRTDPPIDGVADEIERLAKVLHAAAARVEHEHLSVSELERELQAQQAPVLRRLARLTRVAP